MVWPGYSGLSICALSNILPTGLPGHLQVLRDLWPNGIHWVCWPWMQKPLLLLILSGYYAPRNNHLENSDLVRIYKPKVFMIIIHLFNAARLSECSNSFLRINVLNSAMEIITHMLSDVKKVANNCYAKHILWAYSLRNEEWGNTKESLLTVWVPYSAVRMKVSLPFWTSMINMCVCYTFAHFLLENILVCLCHCVQGSLLSWGQCDKWGPVILATVTRVTGLCVTEMLI